MGVRLAPLGTCSQDGVERSAPGLARGRKKSMLREVVLSEPVRRVTSGAATFVADMVWDIFVAVPHVTSHAWTSTRELCRTQIREIDGILLW